MMRQSLRRCARQASTSASPSLLLQSRVALQSSSRRAVLNATCSKPLSRFALFSRVSRPYSTEASEAQASEPVAQHGGPATKFQDLAIENKVHQNILRAIVEDMGYENMTPVQAKTINPALSGTDIVAQAKTGTGKTIAFLLPLLQRMINEDPSLAKRSTSRTARSDDIRGIVMSPTRELAEQIAHEARQLVRHTGLVVQCAVGGKDRRAMLHRTRQQGCHLLVATPGRLNDLLSDETSSIDAPNLAALVLDEADRMLDVGFESQIQEILTFLPSEAEKSRQTLLVSATIPDNVIRLARSLVRANDFEFVQTIGEHENLTHDKVPQRVIAVNSWNDMLPVLFERMSREIQRRADDRSLKPFKAIVYCNMTTMTELFGQIGRVMKHNGDLPVYQYRITSKNSQAERDRASNSFKRAQSAVLFSSDVTARGMDFPDVTHVIQVDCARERESYIHRLGRTGRQEKEGEGWLLLPPQSVSKARKLLRGLPLQQDTERASTEQLDHFRDAVIRAAEEVPRDAKASAYVSMVGSTQTEPGDKDEIIKDLNDMSKYSLGLSEPPTVSRMWAQKMGLLGTALNIGEPRPARRSFGDEENRFGDRRFGGDRFSRDRNGSGPRRGGFSRDRDQRPRDPFDAFKRDIRRS